jgi:hypothetical protein
MSWIYKGQEITAPPLKAFGFVYQITNLISGKKYIGRKYFSKAHTTQVKGKKKKSRIESDWLTYWGSNSELQADVAAHGPENFRREILYIGFTRGTVNYMESKFIMVYECLESDDWYNGWMSCKVNKSWVLGKL